MKKSPSPLYCLVTFSTISLLFNCKIIESNGLEWDQFIRVALDPSGIPLTIDTPQDTPSDTAFIMLQGHVVPPPADNSLDLSIEPGFVDPLVATGRDVGLVSMETDIRRWYIRQHGLMPATNGSKSTNTSRAAWLLFSAKSWSEPLPGGCCANRSSQGSSNSCAAFGPILRVQRPSSGVLLELEFEPAAALAKQAHSTYRILCDHANQTAPEPELRYRLYVAEADSLCNADWPSLLRRMSTAQQAEAYGSLVGEFDGKSFVGGLRCCRFLLGSRDNLPLVATVVAELRATSEFSAYAPVLLLSMDRADLRCTDRLCVGIDCLVLSSLAIVIGTFLCTVGFRYFSASVFLNGLISGSLLVVPILLRHASLQPWLAYLLGIAGAGGVVGTAALIAWLKLRSNPLAYLIMHLPCCYALACLLFATPFGRLWWLTGHEGLFFTALAAAIILYLLLLLLFAGMGALFSLSIVGVTLVILGVSAVLPKPVSFPYLFVDLHRRTAYQGYHGALLFYNFYKAADVILAVSLPVGAALCCLLQFACNRRDGFDPSLRHQRQRLLPHEPPAGSSINVSYGSVDAAAAVVSSSVLAAERTPLVVTAGVGRQHRGDANLVGQRSI